MQWGKTRPLPPPLSDVVIGYSVAEILPVNTVPIDNFRPSLSDTKASVVF